VARLNYRCERQERNIAGALNGRGQFVLMGRARPCKPAREDLSAFRDELPDQLHVLVIDDVYFFVAKLTDFTAAEVLLPWSSGRTSALPPWA